MAHSAWAFGHSEIRAPVSYKFVSLFKRAFVKQQVDTLTRRQLAFSMLPFATLQTTAFFRQSVATRKLVHSTIFHRVGL